MGLKRDYRVGEKDDERKPKFDKNQLKQLLFYAKPIFHLKYFIWIAMVLAGVYFYFPKPRRDWRLGVYAKDKLDLQDIICSQVWSDICYLIVDKYEVDLYGQIGYSKNFNAYENFSQYYTRSLLANSNKQGITSMTELIPTQGEMFTKKNSAKWKIKKNRLIFPYLKIMAALPYITETISDEKTPIIKILNIGLGGASITNFYGELPNKTNITIVEIDPAMKEVAQKWFGLEINDRQRLFVDDGVEFMKKLPDDEKFDIIFIDACHNKREDNIKCPIPEFRSQEMAETSRIHLTENGVVILNVFITGDEENHNFKKLLQFYKISFENCISIKTMFVNMVLACTNNNLPKITSIEYQKRFKNMPLPLKNVLKEQLELVNFS